MCPYHITPQRPYGSQSTAQYAQEDISQYGWPICKYLKLFTNTALIASLPSFIPLLKS